MPIAPPRRISKTRKRKRRTHYKIEVPGMMLCPNCGEMKLSHMICKACGFYDGRQIIAIKEKAAEEDADDKTAKKAKKQKVEEKVAEPKAVKKPVRKVETAKAADDKKVVRKVTKKPQKAD